MSSGSFDYSVTADDIILQSLEDLGIVTAGESVDSDDKTMALRTLNLLVKQWCGKGDQLPGFKVWQRGRGYVFLSASQETYSLGPSGDHATEDYHKTTLTATEPSTETSMAVVSTTGAANSDFVGVVLDNNTIHWTTISSSTSTTITLASGLTSQASSGNPVFYYTSKIVRPLSIETMVLRDETDQDIPIRRMNDIFEYEAITDKTDSREPTAWFYEEQLTNGVLYLDGRPDDVAEVLRFVFLKPADDLDASTDTFAFPQTYYAALEWELARRLAPKFKVEWTPAMENNYISAMTPAQMMNPKESYMYFQPEVDGHA